MSVARLPINSLSGGVGRQAPTKRLTSEAENIDNCLVTLEKSIEKRPPLVSVEYYTNDDTPTNSSYLPVNGLDLDPLLNFNPDNVFFHFLDIDGFNRYCIIINRAGYSFDPVVAQDFTLDGVTIGLDNFLTVFRIEPTRWIKEVVDNTTGISGNTSGFNRGIFEYLTLGNKKNTFSSAISYKIANGTVSLTPRSIKDTFGSADLDVGMILWNKEVPLDYLPNRYSEDTANASTWFSTLPQNQYIHSGDLINYKVSVPPQTPDPFYEDTLLNPVYITNVRDDIRFSINTQTYEESEIGQSLENFGEIPQFPAEEVFTDVKDFSGYHAGRALHHLYDNPRVIPSTQYVISATKVNGTANLTVASTALLSVGMYVRGAATLDRFITVIENPTTITVSGANFGNGNQVTITVGRVDWNKDHYQRTSPLPAEDRDGNTNYFGFGKVYQSRNPFLTFPAGFYRATRYGVNPYFERVRSEGINSVFDHRRFPIIIYKDTKGDGKWRVKHMPLIPRRSGSSLSNPGPKALERKETIQSIAIWKSRLWIATENTLIGSRTNSFFNFWVDDVNNFVDSDPIDLQSSIGAYNKLSFIVPFQSIMFAASSGSVQFEVRGGDTGAGLSPFNVELRPTSFYSTSKLVEPQKMGDKIFFMDSGRMYMYLSGGTFNDEFSTSLDISTHCRGYIPTTFGPVCSNSAVNSIFFVDGANKYHIYNFTFRVNGEKIIQNAFSRWILASQDNVVAMRSYEKDLYIVSMRISGPVVGPVVNAPTKLVVYFVSLESVPVATPMLDWLVRRTPASMALSSGNTIITLPHYDPAVNYVVLAPEWGSQAYTAFQPLNVSYNGANQTTITISGTWNAYPVYVGRSYLMNIELSPQVYRSTKSSTAASEVYEGVLNMKRATFRHFNTGNYDVVVERKRRAATMTTFFPTDINSIMLLENELKIDTVGEHAAMLLSYSEDTKIYIRSAYPTPCNISNIEILGNFRSRNTSTE